MESYQSNIDIIKTENNTFRVRDKDNIYELTIIKRDINIDFTFNVEGGINTYKATLTIEDLSKFSLFKIVESLDNAIQIMNICLNNKGVTLRFDKTYSLVFFSLFFNTYVTATVELNQEGNSIETTVARLSDMIISQYKEINSLKAMMADFKDQINVFMSTMNDKFIAQEKMISEFKPQIDFIKEMQSVFDLSAHSKILKKEEYELLKTWIGSKFELELLYSTYKDGDNAATFHLKCDGISPTLIVIQSSNGNRFGGYTRSKWHQIIHMLKVMGVNLYFP
jgi:hypothetical protein